MPGRSFLLPPERSHSDPSLSNHMDSKKGRKERKVQKRSKEQRSHVAPTDDISCTSENLKTEEGDKRKSGSLTRLFGKMKKSKSKEIKEDEKQEENQYGSPDGSEISSSGYYTPLAQTTDYDSPTTPVPDSDNNSSNNRLRDPLEKFPEEVPSRSLRDLMTDTTVTNVPESSEVHLLGPTVTKLADQNGKGSQTPHEIANFDLLNPSNTEEESPAQLSFGPNIDADVPIDVDSDFSNTSHRSISKSLSSENLKKYDHPDFTTGIEHSQDIRASESLENHRHDDGKDAAHFSETNSPENHEEIKSADSRISSLPEYHVSHTDSDSGLYDTNAKRKPFMLPSPKPYSSKKSSLPVNVYDTLPAYQSSEKPSEGVSPPPPSPTYSNSEITEPTQASVRTSKGKRNSIDKALPPVPRPGCPAARERKAMMDSDNSMKHVEPEFMGKDNNEHLYKILVIGELGTGKTSIIKRYVHEFFSQHYRATIGVDFALKVVHWDENTVVRLQLWDIAGQERFNNMTRVYYKEAVGAFIVFDVTRAATFDAVMKWKQDLDSKVLLPDGSPIPCALLANKCDQPKEGIANSPSKLNEFCKEKGFIGWFETSAKDNVNIENAARFLIKRILENNQWQENKPEQDTAKVSLGKQDNRNKKMSCC